MSKIGVVSVENIQGGFKMQGYINNFEIENYFLKGVTLGNVNEYQSLNGASISIQKTGFYGEVTVVNR